MALSDLWGGEKNVQTNDAFLREHLPGKSIHGRCAHAGDSAFAENIAMQRIVVLLALTGCLLGLVQGVSLAAEKFQVDAAALAKLAFEPPKTEQEKQYLGLSGTEKFTLPRIKARVIVVEVFSMYCPICQAEAENVNELHRLVESDAALKGKVKFLGVGAGNTPFEVNVFREKFNVAFALVPDDGFQFQKVSTGVLKTPTFVVLSTDRRKGLTVVETHVGRLGDVTKYLKTIKKAMKGS